MRARCSGEDQRRHHLAQVQRHRGAGLQQAQPHCTHLKSSRPDCPAHTYTHPVGLRHWRELHQHAWGEQQQLHHDHLHDVHAHPIRTLMHTLLPRSPADGQRFSRSMSRSTTPPPSTWRPSACPVPFPFSLRDIREPVFSLLCCVGVGTARPRSRPSASCASSRGSGVRCSPTGPLRPLSSAGLRSKAPTCLRSTARRARSVSSLLAVTSVCVR